MFYRHAHYSDRLPDHVPLLHTNQYQGDSHRGGADDQQDWWGGCLYQGCYSCCVTLHMVYYYQEDEETMELFVAYIGSALHHAKLYDKIRKSEAKIKVVWSVFSNY